MKPLALVTSLCLFPPAVFACGSYEYFKLLETAQDATSEDEKAAARAIRRLRSEGPAGLDALLSVYHKDLEKLRTTFLAPLRASDERLVRIRDAIDRVAGQKDAASSRLFWHTDLERAKKRSTETGKPILSLRLLGRLDDELSCANSRFFRTVLYANENVSRRLRERFILHWQSVRSVPRITIDFGDGKKLESTITGNSIHYALDSNGRVVDALPGLYGPKVFEEALERIEAVSKALAKLDGPTRDEALRTYHRDRALAVRAQWNDDLIRVGVNAKAKAGEPKAPPAVAAERVSVGKRLVEIDTVVALLPDVKRLGELTDDTVWKRLAELRGEAGVLDPSSIRLMYEKHPRPEEAMRLAFAKARVEDPMLTVIQNFQRSLAEDTVRNEYGLHLRIHEWMAGGATTEPDALNARVYAELFLTPLDDPWMGLSRPEIYTALPCRGIVGNDS